MIEDDVTEFTGAKYVANALVVFEVCMVLSTTVRVDGPR